MVDSSGSCSSTKQLLRYTAASPASLICCMFNMTGSGESEWSSAPATTEPQDVASPSDVKRPSLSSSRTAAAFPLHMWRSSTWSDGFVYRWCINPDRRISSKDRHRAGGVFFIWSTPLSWSRPCAGWTPARRGAENSGTKLEKLLAPSRNRRQASGCHS